MCRILAYAGPPVTLNSLVSAPEHGLLRQSYLPREMTSGVVNADGFGFAWYGARDGEPNAEQAGAAAEMPFLYRHILPIWSDPNLDSLERYVVSGRILGYIRSATPGQALDMSNTQPFIHGRLAFVHNGFMAHFRTPRGQGLHRRLRAALDEDIYAAIGGSTDSEHLFLWLVQHIRSAGSLAGGIEAGLQALAPLAGDIAITLNFAVTDGETVVAVRHGLNTEAPTLYSLVDHARFPGASLVASEPLFDDPAWTPIPSGSLLTLPADARHGATPRQLAA